MISLRTIRTIIVGVILMAAASTSHAQLMPGTTTDGMSIPPDTLKLTEEWWVGAAISANYAMGFGTMTVTYIGGTAPGSNGVIATTEGGYGYGIAFAPSIEYRAVGSALGLMVNVGVDYQAQVSTSTVPIANDEYAYNATFEANSAILYGSIAALAKYSFGGRGWFVIGGPTVSLPVWSDSYLWQHETLPDGQDVGEQPGFPNTSIKFDTEPEMRPRVGLQIGFGVDIMSGLFGYTGQLISPYVMLQGATPVVSDPTAWNSLFLRAGAIWRMGI
jgi:hypothetical protein